MISKAEISFAKALSDKRERMQTGLFVLEGEKIIGELTLSDVRIEKLYSTQDVPCVNGVESTMVTAREMERISQLKTPTPYLAIAQIPHHEFDADSLRDKLVLALDDVQDPGNVGTIIRIADWFGIHNIICSEATADCYNPKVVQATMGALLRVKIHYGNLEQILPQIGTAVYGTFLEGENIYKAKLKSDAVIVMGNEGRGINDKIARLTTDKLYIPPFPEGTPTSESLNVATATAIICSEFRRR